MSFHVSSDVGLLDVMFWGGRLPEDLVYEGMKAISDHVDELLPVYPIARVWTENRLLMTPVLPVLLTQSGITNMVLLLSGANMIQA